MLIAESLVFIYHSLVSLPSKSNSPSFLVNSNSVDANCHLVIIPTFCQTAFSCSKASHFLFRLKTSQPTTGKHQFYVLFTLWIVKNSQLFRHHKGLEFTISFLVSKGCERRLTFVHISTEGNWTSFMLRF